MDSSKPLVIAHRGESYDAPENTLAAVNLAWERNADAVEIDVHLSKDGKIVVIHDNNTLRTAHRYGKVSDQTLEQLRRLDVGKYKGTQWTKEKIPTLAEVLETVPRGKKLFIEIKDDSSILAEFKRVLENSSLSPDQIIIIGLDVNIMEAIKKALPEYQVCWVCDIKDEKRMNSGKPQGEGLISRTHGAGLDGLDVHTGKEVDEDFIARVKSTGMKLYIWTVNDPEEARRLFEWGVDGITTDRAHWLKTRLRDN